MDLTEEVSHMMKIKQNDHFYQSLFLLVIPIAIQNLISALSSSADVVMLGFVNQESLSAVSLAGQITFVFGLLMAGLTLGSGMLTSQYWGKKDTASIEKVLGISLRFSAIAGVTFFLMTMMIPEILMGLFTPDPELVRLGAAYLKVVGLSYLFMSASQIYLAVIRSMERAGISSLISTVSMLVNIILNAVFIFGLFGMPKLGIKGVAIATVTARGIELAWCIAHSCFKSEVKIRMAYLIHTESVLLRDFLRYTLPVLCNEIVWGGAFTSFTAIIGHVNSDFVAANSVASVVKNLVVVLCTGIASGGTVLIGKSLGEDKFEDARRDGTRLCKISVLCGVVSGCLILLIKPLIFSLITLSPAAAEYLDGMLYICAYYCIGKSVNITSICGIFCAGGDSRFGLQCDAVVMWLVILPLGLLSAFVWKLPPVWIYFVLSLDEFCKIPFVYRHYKQYRWIKNITRDLSPES